jgi:CSLREA domain-containing protein
MNDRRITKWRLLTLLATFALPVFASTAAAFGIFLEVNSTGDGADAAPGNGICETASGNRVCTLRAAIMEANAHAGDDSIGFSLPAPSTITLTSALPNLSTNINIIGPGADKLTVSGANAYRVFTVTASGTVSLSGITIASGKGSQGGGISTASGTLNISDCTLRTNLSTSTGGAIYKSGGTVNIAGSALFGNKAGEAGGIENAGGGPLTISNSTLSANEATNGYGGAIRNNSGTTLVITNSTFDGNSAYDFAGGIMADGSVTISNSTFFVNKVTANPVGFNAYGGAIYHPQNGALSVTNCTFSGNSATGVYGSSSSQGHGGGISGGGSVKSTIIANNTASPSSNPSPDVDGSFTSGGFNLIGKIEGSTGFTATTDQTGTIANPLDPKLDPNGLQNNGGPTLTLALQSNSPAINKGDPNAPARDQRGYVRQNTPDTGAYELGGIIPVTLANISTRMKVEAGDNALIGGFIVTGTHDKRVIVLAIGPSLAFADKLANPTLELYAGNTLLETNDNWVDSANKQAIMDSGAAPPSNLESAIIRTLPANNSQYTAVVRGAGNGTGIASVQVYDLDRTTDSKLANISTRGDVQGGDDIMIAGFIISGTDQQKVIVLAIGPSLTVPGKLPDPTLQLVNQQGTILDENDNWGDSANKQAIIDSGIAPTNSLESAIVATLPSGNAQYTAIVRGAGGATGVAVVQVYALN